MNKNSQQNLLVWDAVSEANLNARAFFLLPAQIVPLVRNEKYTPYIDIGKVHELLGTLDRDVSDFRRKLNDITARHANRKGGASDADDHMRALNVAEAYQTWGASYESVILPTIASITDIYAAAEKKIVELAAQQSIEPVLQNELANAADEPGNEIAAINETLPTPDQQDASTHD